VDQIAQLDLDRSSGTILRVALAMLQGEFAYDNLYIPFRRFGTGGNLFAVEVRMFEVVLISFRG
tara:strand:- start:718 stop:909 length:192 start_codon:yes stop_codon:yes gene_type:complete